MIEEIMENRISDNLDSFFESMVSFFGEKHRRVLNDKMKDIEFAVVIDKGYFSVGNTELYVEEEPICVKEGDKSYVLIPATILKEKTGNVSLMHSLLHAISDDYIRNENDLLNEVVTDYMANEISKELKDRDVNVTLEKNPSYDSESFYSNFYDIIEKLYFERKEDVFDALILGDRKLSDDIEGLIIKLEERFNDILFDKEKSEKNNIVKK